MLSLYRISEEVEAISQEIEACNGEMTETLTAQADIVKDLLMKKTEGVVSWARQLEDTIELVEIRRKELQELEKSLKNKLTRFKDYVKYCMHTMGLKKIDSPFARMSMTKGRHVVQIVDEKLLDEKYLNKTITVNKTLIADDIKAGIDVRGAFLRTGEEGLSMKLK